MFLRLLFRTSSHSSVRLGILLRYRKHHRSPLAALLYIGAGKHPVVGMICGYAGANAGFTANLMVAGTDSLLSGLTNDAIKGFLPDTSFQVDVTCNWFFMIASTFLCSIVIGFVCTKVVEPRFGKYEGNTDEKIEKLTSEESKGLRAAAITAIVVYHSPRNRLLYRSVSR